MKGQCMETDIQLAPLPRALNALYKVVVDITPPVATHIPVTHQLTDTLLVKVRHKKQCPVCGDYEDMFCDPRPPEFWYE